MDYKELLELARESIKLSFHNKKPEVNEKLRNKFSEKKACFVTLTLKGELRGCIGSIYARQELWKDVIENAIHAAFDDPRFPPLKEQDFDKIKIEISILSIPRKISYITEQELEKKIKNKGVIIKKSFYSATYLPQVWDEIPDFMEFIGSLCEKAGLSPDAWKRLDLEVFIYDAKKVSE